MMAKFLKSLALIIVPYLVVAFTMWDWEWITRMGEYEPIARILFLFWMFVAVFVLCVIHEIAEAHFRYKLTKEITEKVKDEFLPPPKTP